MAIIAGGSSQPDNPSAIAAAAAFIFMFSFFFPTGFLGLTFLYAAEIAPLSHRSSITAISTGSAWLFNFVSFAPLDPDDSVVFLTMTAGRGGDNACRIFDDWLSVSNCLRLY